MIKHKFNSFDIILLVALLVLIFTLTFGIRSARNTHILDIEYTIVVADAPKLILDSFTAGDIIYNENGNEIGKIVSSAISSDGISDSLTLRAVCTATESADAVSVGGKTVAVGSEIYFSSKTSCASGICTELTCHYKK